MFTAFLNACNSLINCVKSKLKKITKPATATIAVGAFSDLPRNKSDLIVENAMLRQQLIILKRSVKQPKLTTGDRVRLSLLAGLTNFWHSAMHIVQPETLLRWHRDMFRWYWRRKSKAKSNQLRIPQETIDLIRQMAQENPLWKAKKIQGELLKLGIKLHKHTIRKYMKQVRRRTSQTWKTFLKNHKRDIWACDFTVIYTLFFKPLYVFVIMKHETREVVHTAVTYHPTDAWTAQQLREATPWGWRPRFLILDNDKKFGDIFSTVARSSGIKELRTPFQAPRANAIQGRFMGTLKRECCDHFFIFSQQQLHRIVKEFVAYYNSERAHQGIEQRIPSQFWTQRPQTSHKLKGKVVTTSHHCCGSLDCVDGQCCIGAGRSSEQSNYCCAGLALSDGKCCAQRGGECETNSDCCGDQLQCNSNVCGCPTGCYWDETTFSVVGSEGACVCDPSVEIPVEPPEPGEEPAVECPRGVGIVDACGGRHPALTGTGLLDYECCQGETLYILRVHRCNIELPEFFNQNCEVVHVCIPESSPKSVADSCAERWTEYHCGFERLFSEEDVKNACEPPN